MEPETRVEFANIHVCCGIWLDGFILRFQVAKPHMYLLLDLEVHTV